MKRTLGLIIFLIVFTTSCAAPLPVPTATTIETATLAATKTPTHTSTPKLPTETADVVAALLPSGTPANEWEGIPIMPGAINGEGDNLGYIFTTKSTSEAIQQYYEAELAKQGYEPFAAGQGNEKDTVLLIYIKGEDLITISIIPHDDLNLVVIAK